MTRGKGSPLVYYSGGHAGYRYAFGHVLDDRSPCPDGRPSADSDLFSDDGTCAHVCTFTQVDVPAYRGIRIDVAKIRHVAIVRDRCVDVDYAVTTDINVGGNGASGCDAS